MIKYLLMMVTGLVLFAAAASASWLMKPEEPETEEAEEATAQTAQAAPPLPSPDEIEGAQVTESIESELTPSQGVSAETVLRLSDSIRKREKGLLAREQALERDEKRLKLMLDDLRRERSEITALFEEAEQRAAQARAMLEEVNASSQMSGNQPGSMNIPDMGQGGSTEQNKPTSEHELKNLQTVAEWLKEMPAEKAAKSIQDLCNDGNTEMAVQLFGFLEQRDAAKILAAIQDPALVTNLLGRFRTLDNTKR